MAAVYFVFLFLSINASAMNIVKSFGDLDKDNTYEINTLEKAFQENYAKLNKRHKENPYQFGYGLQFYKTVVSDAKNQIRKLYRVDNNLMGYFIAFQRKPKAAYFQCQWNKFIEAFDVIIVSILAIEQNKGYGSDMLCEIVKWAEKYKAPSVWVSVAIENTAIEFYKKNGFKETGILRNHDETKGAITVWLIKYLSPYQKSLLSEISKYKAITGDLLIKYNKN